MDNASKTLLLTGGTVVLPDRCLKEATVRIEKGKIVSIEANSKPPNPLPEGLVHRDVSGKVLAPGMVDMHVHGGAGYDFMDGTPEAIQEVCRAHLRHGTTTIVPTTTTGDASTLHAMIQACLEVRGDSGLPEIVGVHLYGPYFAAEKVGCHSREFCRVPRQTEYQSYFETGFIRIATCAAELDGARDFYRVARQNDCLITCGHSNASWPEMQTAFQEGMRHVDHFWCAMSSVPSLRSRFGTPMQASMAEFVLMNRMMSTEVIADGFHLSPELLEFALQMIGPERLCLVTDCNRALEMPPGEYRFGNLEHGTWFRSDGQVGWAIDGSSLASSIVGMDTMVRTMKSATSATLAEVFRMASLTPAVRLGIAERKGSLEVGKDADVLVFSPELNLQQVILRGRLMEALGDDHKAAD